MSSSSQASDLSMDEILASIRKIISEDPKPATAAGAPTVSSPAPRGAVTVTASAAPTALGTISIGGTGGQHSTRSASSRFASGGEPGEGAARPARSLRPALDDDILDLIDDERPTCGSTATPAGMPSVAVAASPPTAERGPPPAGVARPADVAKSDLPAVSRLPMGEMWTPREWSRPSDGGAPAPLAGPSPSSTTAALPVADVVPASPSSTAAPAARPTEQAHASEARLGAAIAALGQSLAAQPAGSGFPAQKVWSLPDKPMVVASAPAAPPHAGPRIDVVAVVNAATRAALAQRSADDQTAASASALPSASAAAPAQSASPTSPSAATTAIEPVPDVAMDQVMTVEQAPEPVRAAAVMPVETRLPEAKAAEVAKPVVAAPIVQVVAPPPAFILPAIPSPPPRPTLPSPAQASQAQAPAPVAGVQTLEDTVARLLRPMLRQWLDDNMPRIVEKAFQEELATQIASPPAAELGAMPDKAARSA